MTLDAKGFFAAEPCMVTVVRSFARMTANTGQNLTCSWIEDIFANGMGELRMFLMAFSTNSINLLLYHSRVVGAMWRMAVVTGISPRMAEFR